jgi:hypothetical protein
MLDRLASVTLFAMVACGGGGGGGGGGDGGSIDSRPIDVGMYDFSCGGGSACSLNDVCCAAPGMTTTFSCVAAASCAAADKIACDGPDECSGTAPVCCGVDVPTGTGSYPTCAVMSLGTSCTSAAACPTHLATSCTDTTKVQLCHDAADCTDATNNMCCTFASGGASLTFCIDQTTAQFGGATCHP